MIGMANNITNFYKEIGVTRSFMYLLNVVSPITVIVQFLVIYFIYEEQEKALVNPMEHKG